MPRTIRFKLAILSVHGLDDTLLQKEWGITNIEYVGRNDVLITFESRAKIINFASACEDRAMGVVNGWDQPKWFARSAVVARKTADAYLAMTRDEGPNDPENVYNCDDCGRDMNGYWRVGDLALCRFCKQARILKASTK